MNKEDERPFLVTLLGLGVLILTVFNAVRFGSALAQWDLLLDFTPRPGPLYIAATGLIWTLGWLIVYLSIELKWKWARKAIFAFSILYIAYYWIDRLLFQTSQERSNIKFIFIGTVLGLAFVILTLTLPKSRVYFTDEPISNHHKERAND
jgi:hypothetical protein